MRKNAVIAALVIGLLACSTLAQAQDKKVQVNFGGGYSATTGKLRDSLGDGGHFVAGVTFYPNAHFGVQAEYGYHAFGQKTLDVPQPIGFVEFNAGHHMHAVTFNV